LKRTNYRAAGGAVLASVVLGAIVLMLGLVRYGGPEGLWRRAYSEIAGRLPHPDYVPTPLAGEISASLFDEPAAAPIALATATVEPDASAPTETATDIATGTAETPAAQPVASSVLFRANTSAGRAASVTDPGERAALKDAQPAAAAIATVTRTPQPTAPPTRQAATPAPVAQAAPEATLQLSGMAHFWQTWNNCGPATLAMDLSYFGVKLGQDKVAAVLRPYKDDKNVNPWEMAEFARSQGLRAVARVNGDTDRLRALLQAGVPVLIETWYEPKPKDGMGHYRLLVGYDDAAREWIAYDSYDSHGIKKDQPYAGIRMPYDQLEALWRVFNRTYIPVYDEARAAAVEAIIGPDLDDTAMWQRSLRSAEDAVHADEQDAFAWFNAGSSLAALGDYERAAEAFDQARRIRLPWRMLWYQFAPFRAYYEVGRYDEVIALADATLKTGKSLEEVYYWKGMAQKANGDPGSAANSWRAALQFNPNFTDASAALAALQQ
jgi:tetratricopeptide (TPR) repeat protein